jgi:hypothetical protein
MRDGIFIIDLEQTLIMLKRALNFIKKVCLKRGYIFYIPSPKISMENENIFNTNLSSAFSLGRSDSEHFVKNKFISNIGTRINSNLFKPLFLQPFGGFSSFPPALPIRAESSQSNNNVLSTQVSMEIDRNTTIFGPEGTNGAKDPLTKSEAFQNLPEKGNKLEDYQEESEIKAKIEYNFVDKENVASAHSIWAETGATELGSPPARSFPPL